MKHAMELPREQITAKAFAAYERVRRSGVTNMMMPKAARLAHITRDEHLTILLHYSQLRDRFEGVSRGTVSGATTP